MGNIFIGIVREKSTGEVVHEHISDYSDSTFSVEIWNDEMCVIGGEFRKWHHLGQLIKDEHPELECECYSYEVDAEWLMKMLLKNGSETLS